MVSSCPSFDHSTSLLISGNDVGPLLANKIPPSTSGGFQIIFKLFLAANVGGNTFRPLVAALYKRHTRSLALEKIA